MIDNMTLRRWKHAPGGLITFHFSCFSVLKVLDFQNHSNVGDKEVENVLSLFRFDMFL